MYIERRVLRSRIRIQAKQRGEVQPEERYDGIKELLRVEGPGYAGARGRAAAEGVAGSRVEGRGSRAGELDSFLDGGGELVAVGALYGVDYGARAEDHERRHSVVLSVRVPQTGGCLMALGRGCCWETYARTPYCWATACWLSTLTFVKVTLFGFECFADNDS